MQKKTVKKLIIFGSLILAAAGITWLFVYRLKAYQKHYDTSISKANATKKETEFGQSVESGERNTEALGETNKGQEEKQERKKDDWSNRNLEQSFRGVSVKDGKFVTLSQSEIIPYAVFETEEETFQNKPSFEVNTIYFIDTPTKENNLLVYIDSGLYKKSGYINLQAKRNGVPFNGVKQKTEYVEDYYGNITGVLFTYNFWHQHIDEEEEIYPVTVSDSKGNIIIQSKVTIPGSLYSIYTGDNDNPFTDTPVRNLNMGKNEKTISVSIDMLSKYNVLIYYMQPTEDYNQNVYLPILEVEPSSKFNEFTTIQLQFENPGQYYFAFKNRDSGKIDFPDVRENGLEVTADWKEPVAEIVNKKVNCEGGLRIRNYPGGKSLGYILHESEVTLINPQNVAFEVLIDDIAGYWVNVQVKNENILYKDKPNEYTYGWIFSGYLE